MNVHNPVYPEISPCRQNRRILLGSGRKFPAGFDALVHNRYYKKTDAIRFIINILRRFDGGLECPLRPSASIFPDWTVVVFPSLAAGFVDGVAVTFLTGSRLDGDSGGFLAGL